MEITLEQFLGKVESDLGGLSNFDWEKLELAYAFGQSAHQGQLRASGENYFQSHCVPVAMHLSDIGMDTDMLVAGLLHDTIEDTEVSTEDISQQFGEKIAFMVEGVSKLGKLKYRGNERHVESLRKFFVAVADDVRVVILKLCDRWHNLETLESLPESKRKRIAEESIMIHGQLASRLNMGKLTSIINDLAFPYAYPESYAKTKVLRDSHIKQADKVIESMYRDMLTSLSQTLGYTPKVDRRQKGLYSLYKKLERKDWIIDEIYDLIAIRAIVKTEADCYRALGSIHHSWRPVPGRVKDYIAVPKPNGYQSLHTTVFSGQGPIVEIQIRTEEMHDFAEFGIAAHHNYKQSVNSQSAPIQFDWIRQLGELRTDNRTPSEYLQELRTDYFKDRIFAMTPLGDVIDLPRGATALDFAFAVHTEVGLRAQGAKINGAYRALKTPLNSEDIVEIQTNKNSKPSHTWLDWSVTNMAHTKIRTSLGIKRKFVPGKSALS